MLALVLARLVHEVRSPLQAVFGFGVLLEQRVEGEHRELVHKLVLAAAQLQAIVEEIAAPATWLAPRVVEVPTGEGLAFGELLDRVLAVVDLDAEAEQVRVVVDATADTLDAPAPGMISGGQLVQVLINLLANAIRFAPTESEVRIRVRRRPAWRFEVTDRGPGIDPGDADRIFLPFEKGGERGGSGLGLFIARTIVEGVGGHLTLSPASPETGPGATFVVALPRGR